MPVTICMHTRGNRFAHFERCLNSLLKHTPPGSFELRLGFVQAADSLNHALGTLNHGAVIYRDLLPGVVERFGWADAAGETVRCWNTSANVAKEGMTRLLFCDAPAAGEYLVSFDDDACVIEGWWESLQGVLERKLDYFGHPHWIDYTPDQAAMLKAQPWYTGVPFLQRQGRQGCQFMTGFLAVRAERLRGISLPDGRDDWKWERYRNFGSDIVLGEIARQQNWTQARHEHGVQVRAALPKPESQPNGNGQQQPAEAAS